MNIKITIERLGDETLAFRSESFKKFADLNPKVFPDLDKVEKLSIGDCHSCEMQYGTITYTRLN